MMKFMKRTLNQIADRSCGNFEAAETRFLYRSSSALTRFFEDCDTEYTHDGSTRAYWVANVLEEILADPQESPTAQPPAFQAVIRTLMDRAEAVDEPPDRPAALAMINAALQRDGFEAFYGEDGPCSRWEGKNHNQEPPTRREK